MRVLSTLVIPLAIAGCINENDLRSNYPPPGLDNPQPVEPVWQTDTLVQVTVPEVDVLWIVDNSCSMDAEQAGISMNNPVFMDFFLGSGLDYHIGVVSTDMDDSGHQGRLRQVSGHTWIDEDTPNPSDVFSSMIRMGTSGSADERGRDAGYGALEIRADEDNLGFEREDASLNVIVLSDEGDYSNNIGLTEFGDYLLTKKFDQDMVTFSSIVAPPENCPTAWEPGTEYLWLTDLIGGISWDICDTNWGAVLEELGIQATGLKREYFLSELPVPDSIEVFVKDGPVTHTFERDVDWLYEDTRNSVIFTEFVPSPLAQVQVEYAIRSAAEREDP